MEHEEFNFDEIMADLQAELYGKPEEPAPQETPVVEKVIYQEPKKPSKARRDAIVNELHSLGRALLEIA